MLHPTGFKSPRRGRPLRTVLLLLYLSTATFGCAYYNTFFYAKKYFKAAIEEEKRNTTGKLSPNAAGNYEKAIKQCSKVLQKYGDSKWADDALFLMGRSYFGREEYSQARRWFDELLTKYPKSSYVADAQFWSARSWLAEENYDLASTTLEKIPTDYPNYAELDQVQFYLGEVEFKQERYGNAVDRYQVLVQRYPKSESVTDAYLRIGDALFSQKKYPEAEKSYENAIDRSRDPKQRFEARLKTGQALEKQDRYAEALQVYKKMSEELVTQDRLNQILAGTPDPTDPNAVNPNNNNNDPNNPNFNNQFNPGDDDQNNSAARLNANGINLDGNQNSRLAVSAAVQANPMAIELPRVLLRQGMSLSEMGNDEDAIAIFKGITQAYPRSSESGEAFFRIGYIQEVHQEKYEQARLSYDAARQQGTSLFTEQARRRSEGLARLIQLQAADSTKATNATSAQTEAEKDFLSAELYYFQQDKTDKAMEQYAAVEKNYPESPFAPKAALARAWILTYATQDTAAGRQEYQRVIDTYPKSDQARMARQILTGEPMEPEIKHLSPDSLRAIQMAIAADSAAAADTVGKPLAQGSIDSSGTAPPPRPDLVSVEPANTPGTSVAHPGSAPADTIRPVPNPVPPNPAPPEASPGHPALHPIPAPVPPTVTTPSNVAQGTIDTTTHPSNPPPAPIVTTTPRDTTRNPAVTMTTPGSTNTTNPNTPTIPNTATNSNTTTSPNTSTNPGATTSPANPTAPAPSPTTAAPPEAPAAPARTSRLVAPNTPGLPRPLSSKTFTTGPGRNLPGARQATPNGKSQDGAPVPEPPKPKKNKGIAPRGSLRPPADKPAPPDTTGRGGQKP